MLMTRRGVRRADQLDIQAYALAYSGIADCYNFLGWEAYGTFDPKVTFPRAIAAATQALEIDETLAEA